MQILESPTIEDFGEAVEMSKQEVENLKLILFSVEQGDVGILHSLGIKVSKTKLTLKGVFFLDRAKGGGGSTFFYLIALHSLRSK